jgi:hypothetical protein
MPSSSSLSSPNTFKEMLSSPGSFDISAFPL